MTSNQINWALAQETQRHNKESEDIQNESNRLTEERDKANRKYQLAQTFIDAANAFTNAGNIAISGQGNMLKAQQLAIDNMYKRESLKLDAKQQEINERAQAETARNNREMNRLTLRDVENREYLSLLQAKKDTMTYQNWITQNNLEQSRIWNESSKISLQEQQLANEQFKTQLQAYQTMFNGYELQLQQNRTKVQNAADIIKSVNDTLNTLNRTVSSYLLTGGVK